MDKRKASRKTETPLQSASFAMHWHDPLRGFEEDEIQTSIDRNLLGDFFDTATTTETPRVFPFSHFNREAEVLKYLSRNGLYACFLSSKMFAIVPSIESYSWEDFNPILNNAVATLLGHLPTEEEDFHLHLHLQYNNQFNSKDNQGLKGADFINERTNLQLKSSIEGYQKLNIENTSLSWKFEEGRLLSLFNENTFSTQVNILCISNIVEANLDEVETWAIWAHRTIRGFFDSLLVNEQSRNIQNA